MAALGWLSQSVLQVGDFNLSRVMEESAILSSMAASNPRWLAPEILSGRGYTFSSDVYSFGVIMWEFLTWQIPWHDCGPWQVCSRPPALLCFVFAPVANVKWQPGYIANAGNHKAHLLACQRHKVLPSQVAELSDCASVVPCSSCRHGFAYYACASCHKVQL